MTLEEGVIGREYWIEDMDLPLSVHMRLRSLGMTRGTVVRVLNRKKKGALICKVRGTRLAVGRDIAAHIATTEQRSLKERCGTQSTNNRREYGKWHLWQNGERKQWTRS